MVWRHIVILLICFVSISEAELSITAINALKEDGSLQCGSQVTLMCRIQPFAGTMSWKAGNATMMSCTSGTCGTHPPYHPNYGFVLDRDNGIFNLTISPVKFTENRKQFECSDGSLSQFFMTSVKVLPENSTTVLTSTNSTNETEHAVIAVTTGCVYPAENVQFQWYYMYFKDGEPPILYTDGQQTDGPTNGSITDCTSGDCGGDDVKQMISTLTLHQDEDGEDYYIQAVVTSSDVSDKIVVTSNTSYRLKVSGENVVSFFEDLGTNVGLIVALTLIGIAIVVITVAIFVVLLTKWPVNPEKERIMRN